MKMHRVPSTSFPAASPTHSGKAQTKKACPSICHQQVPLLRWCLRARSLSGAAGGGSGRGPRRALRSRLCLHPQGSCSSARPGCCLEEMLVGCRSGSETWHKLCPSGHRPPEQKATPQESKRTVRNANPNIRNLHQLVSPLALSKLF